MPSRRDVLLAVPLLAAAAGAYALTPRNRMNLLGSKKLEDVVPLAFDGWSVSPSDAFVLPEPREGSLADILYDQQLHRLYTGEGRLPVMLVIAYGSTQSDLLQLHRPETCYPAIGFEVTGSRRVDVRIGDAEIPMRELTATSTDRIEPVLYWTRLGDRLPTSNNEQRLMKLRTEMEGYIADGVLVRMSTVADPSAEISEGLRQFARSLVLAIDPDSRAAFVGRPVAGLIAQSTAPGASA